MTDTTSVTAPDSERLLVRPADDRVVAGVCSGLARYFDMSPLVYRVAFAALILLGGAGLILYAAAWLVIPDERRGDSIVGEAIRNHRHRPWLLVGVGLIGFGVLLGITETRLWPDPGDVWLAALAVGLFVVWWQVRERREDERAETGAVAAPESASAPVGPAGAEPAPGGTQPPRRRRYPVFLITLGVVIAGAGVLGVLEAADVVDVDWTLALAVAVVVVGIAVAVGAFFGSVGALAALGAMLLIVMVPVVAIDVPLDGPIGDRYERPLTAAELEDDYEVSIGQLTLDLRGLTLPPGTTRISASVGMGELIVQAPADAQVVIDGHATAGEIDLFGDRDDGWDVEHDAVAPGPTAGAPTLEVDADVGFGSIEARHG